jgi:D-aminopeptidase
VACAGSCATEEAILNSPVANDDMTGRDGNFVPALPQGWFGRTFPPRS